MLTYFLDEIFNDLIESEVYWIILPMIFYIFLWRISVNYERRKSTRDAAHLYYSMQVDNLVKKNKNLEQWGRNYNLKYNKITHWVIFKKNGKILFEEKTGSIYWTVIEYVKKKNLSYLDHYDIIKTNKEPKIPQNIYNLFITQKIDTRNPEIIHFISEII